MRAGFSDGRAPRGVVGIGISTPLFAQQDVTVNVAERTHTRVFADNVRCAKDKGSAVEPTP